MSSSQHDLPKKPRVHITYDVHTGDAFQKQELPFVVGVLADLSGDSGDKLPRLKKRKFIDVNRMNFDKVLSGIAPTLNFLVENRLQPNQTEMSVKLKFESMEDFEPVQVALQVARTVPKVAKLMELRRQIKRLLLTMQDNEALEGLVQKLIDDEAALKQLCQEAGSGAPQPEAKPGETRS